jgi:hypothetical protein
MHPKTITKRKAPPGHLLLSDAVAVLADNGITCSQRWLQRLCQEERIPSRRLGDLGWYYVPESAVADLISSESEAAV